MHKITNRLFIVLPLLFLLILSACHEEDIQTEETTQISGVYENKEAVKTARELLLDNLYYAETENIKGYLSTIPSDAHADTREAMEEFFKTHEVSHELTAFEVLEESKDKLAVQTKQKTTGEDETGETEYRNHIAEVLIVFQRIDNEWKIAESSVTDIIFID